MPLTLEEEFAKLTAETPPSLKTRITHEMWSIRLAIRAHDYGVKSFIPVFGLLYGFAAVVLSVGALGLNGCKDHPVRRPAAAGGLLGALGFCASLLWFIDR